LNDAGGEIDVDTDDAADLSECVPLAMSPWLLGERTAVSDFQSSGKIIFGTESAEVLATLETLYATLIEASDSLVVWTDLATTMILKYANSVSFATKSRCRTISETSVRSSTLMLMR